jgi:hypothetical protein
MPTCTNSLFPLNWTFYLYVTIQNTGSNNCGYTTGNTIKEVAKNDKFGSKFEFLSFSGFTRQMRVDNEEALNISNNWKITRPPEVIVTLCLLGSYAVPFLGYPLLLQLTLEIRSQQRLLSWNLKSLFLMRIPARLQ